MSLARIFDVEEGVVKINENCYLIPEFRKLVEKFPNPIPVFTFIHLTCAPDSPYANFEEAEKLELASQDAGGDFELDDEDLEEAIQKCRKMMLTRVQRLHRAAGMNLDKLSTYLESQELEAGRDGNLSEIYRIQTGLPKLMENFKKLEKMAEEEQQTKLRGSAQAGMY